METDVIVVGAGPAGSYASEECRKRGLRTLVIERRENVGEPVQCSGLISRNVDSFFRPPKDCVEHTVRGAVLHSPGGKGVELFKRGTAAYVIDRGAFDRALLERSRAEKMLGVTVERISVGGGVSVHAGGRRITSQALIGADGPGSLVRRHFLGGRVDAVPGIIAIEDREAHEDYVEMWFDRKRTDGFLWRIPRGEKTEYGMLGRGSTFPALSRFFGIKGFEKRAGSIPVGMHRTYFSRALLVGDAASQTKPWSGGGVVYGMACAGIAAETLKEGFRKGDLSEDFLSRYEEGWHRKVGKNIKAGLMFREIYRSMSNKEIDMAFGMLARGDLSHMDMDFPLMSILD